VGGAFQYLDAVEGPDHEPEREALKYVAIAHLRISAEVGSATAKHALGMLMYISHCDSGTTAHCLDAARWIRKAAMQSLMDAQYELSEMFRCGVFCDHIYIRFARNYIMRATKHGHVAAIARMKELHSCVVCGADNDQLTCSLCHRAKFCDCTCSENHWCEGGGMGRGVSGGGSARHKCICPRTHTKTEAMREDTDSTS
jgi:hypothetical protein